MRIIEKGKGLIKHTHTHILFLSYTYNLILNNKKSNSLNLYLHAMKPLGDIRH